MAETAVAKKSRGDLPATITDRLASAMPHAYKLLPPDVPVERFRAAVMLHLQQSPKLLECQVPSILECCVKAASDGLLPGTECYFLPFKGRASYVQHYHGLIKVLERTGKLKKAFARPVYQGDRFEADYFSDHYTHTSYLVLGTDPGAIRFYYGAILLKDGTPHVELVPLDYIEAIRRRAPGGEQEAWQQNPIEMSRKTALKYTSKYVQLTPELHEMLEEEDARLPAPPTDVQHAATVSTLWGDESPRRAPQGAWGKHSPTEETISLSASTTGQITIRQRLNSLVDEGREKLRDIREQVADEDLTEDMVALEEACRHGDELASTLTVRDDLLDAKAHTIAGLLEKLGAPA